MMDRAPTTRSASAGPRFDVAGKVTPPPQLWRRQHPRWISTTRDGRVSPFKTNYGV